ncbi:MAG TPA: hypothetical protein VHP83_27830 [Aggregatilineaceae bacterium]|nr:hypothetical protein [Aggregatilineaceae bacterium]
MMIDNPAKVDHVTTNAVHSGLYYPNRMGRLYFTALEEVMGTNGLNAILHLAGLDRFIGNYPPEDLERQFDFADFTALDMGLEKMYGTRGGRGLALRGGRVCFSRGLKGFGALAGVGDLAFRVLPLSIKLKIGLPALASVFTNFSDQVSIVSEFEDHYEYTMDPCPVCWNRQSSTPCCHVGVGVLQEGLRWVSGGLEFRVVETACHARGDERCICTIFKEPLNRE